MRSLLIKGKVIYVASTFPVSVVFHILIICCLLMVVFHFLFHITRKNTITIHLNNSLKIISFGFVSDG